MATVALLLDRTFDEAPFRTLYDRLGDAGHRALLIGPHPGRPVSGREGRMHLTLDASLDEVDPDEVDAAIVPRGFRRDHLRTHERLLNFLRDVYGSGKPVGVLHEDSWRLVRADPRGHGAVSWPAVKRDLLIEPEVDPGAWEARALVLGEGGEDAFCDALLAQLASLREVPRPGPGAAGESPHPVD